MNRGESERRLMNVDTGNSMSVLMPVTLNLFKQ